MSTVMPIPELRIDLSYEAIGELCRKYNAMELSVFGSALRPQFAADSDVDFLVTFRNDDAGPWMSYLTGLQDELQSLLGRRVDLIMKSSIERSENYIRRRQILSTARVIYVA